MARSRRYRKIRGTWNATDTYNVGEYVIHATSLEVYKCLTQNTGDEPPSANWELIAENAWPGRWSHVDADFANWLANAMKYRGDWSAGSYDAENVVRRSDRGEIWVATQATSEEPTIVSDIWDLLAFIQNEGLLYGGLANFAPGSSYTPIDTWNASGGTGIFDSGNEGIDPDPITGVITTKLAGFYQLSTSFVFQQGNTNKELAAILWLRRAGGSNNGDFVLDALQISDDKTPFRALSYSGPIAASAGETFQLGMSWINQTLGTCQFAESCNFSIMQKLPGIT